MKFWMIKNSMLKKIRYVLYKKGIVWRLNGLGRIRKGQGPGFGQQFVLGSFQNSFNWDLGFVWYRGASFFTSLWSFSPSFRTMLIWTKASANSRQVPQSAPSSPWLRRQWFCKVLIFILCVLRLCMFLLTSDSFMLLDVCTECGKEKKWGVIPLEGRWGGPEAPRQARAEARWC